MNTETVDQTLLMAMLEGRREGLSDEALAAGARIPVEEVPQRLRELSDRYPEIARAYEADLGAAGA